MVFQHYRLKSTLSEGFLEEFVGGERLYINDTFESVAYGSYS